ncbi:replicative DNA helicase [Hymenobacter sp. M29]|uniref:Replicative DNA helicase n=1 Tax=Hymenobacter mellowenesis TaxID=3063995 RepID=A0ABT9A9E5_9BACT|nr:replicative DNA helicase [Hymenobacter sp. M29]MDO7846463.1 replicative DNA helicase [Hymenobacter sp. M29]
MTAAPTKPISTVASPKPELGYLPPHDLATERAILGAMMLEAPALATVLGIITTEAVFYGIAHQFIFKAIRALFEAGEGVDQITVVTQLRKLGVLERAGGPFAVADLTTKVNSSAHLETHCRLVQEFYARREIIEAGTRMAQHGYDDGADPLDLVTEAQTRLINLHGTMETKQVAGGEEVYDAAFRALAQAMQQEGMTGVDTGIRELNRATNGWQPSDLIVLAARPGMGKTAAMLHFARTCALDLGEACAIFSLEMPKLQLMQRMIASELEGYANSDLRAGRVASEEEFNRIYKAAARLKTPKLRIDDTSGLSIQQLRAKAVRLKAEHDIKLVLVDYIQLMKGSQKGNREQEIGSITRGLKELAKELNVPVIALSQLSRDVEKRGGERRPQLSDLRESGSIEQDADAIVFLWRGEYYEIEEYQDGTATKDTLLFDLAKHRNGALGEIITGCHISEGRFFDLKQEGAFADLQVGAAVVKLGGLPNSTEHTREDDDDNDLPF